MYERQEEEEKMLPLSHRSISISQFAGSIGLRMTSFCTRPKGSSTLIPLPRKAETLTLASTVHALG